MSYDFEVGMVYIIVNHLHLQRTFTGRDIAVLTPGVDQMDKPRQRFSQSFALLLGESEREDLKTGGSESRSARGQQIVK